ncbi:MAG: type II secretion system protein [Phycisphaerales bacterium]
MMTDHTRPRGPGTPRTPRGYTLLEMILTIVAVATIGAAIAPALGSLRGEGYNAQSIANLMQLGQGRDQYALDNKDRIFTYTWRAGETYTMPDGRTYSESDDVAAAARQNQEILMRRTGRFTAGYHKILTFAGRIPHQRFVHLVLMDYMAGDDDEQFLSPTFADPADGDLLNWQERPLDYTGGSSVPYANGFTFGYDADYNWSERHIRQRWPFATSYHGVPFAWQGDGPFDAYVPIGSTPHLYSSQGNPDISGRYTHQVAHPGKKVHLHEEFDREQKRFPWFAYDHAVPEKLMFDGSINSQPSGEANDSVSPAQPGSVWMQRYVPLDTFPIPLGGFGDNTELNMRYRWTEGGLQGIDYD